MVIRFRLYSLQNTTNLTEFPGLHLSQSCWIQMTSGVFPSQTWRHMHLWAQEQTQLSMKTSGMTKKILSILWNPKRKILRSWVFNRVLLNPTINWELNVQCVYEIVFSHINVNIRIGLYCDHGFDAADSEKFADIDTVNPRIKHSRSWLHLIAYCIVSLVVKNGEKSKSD